MRTKTLTIQIFILFLASTLLFAQSSKEMKEKLNNIEGDVNKIVVSTENGDVTFEGKEAKKLFKKMRSKTLHKNIEWISKDGHDFDSESDNVMIFKSDKGGKHIIKEFKDSDNVMIIKTNIDKDIELIDGNKKIQIEVEEENGEKTVSVTTNEDGEEKVETFKGKEADEYLEKMEDEHEMLIDIDVDFDEDKNFTTNKIWIHTDDDDHNIEEKIKIEVNDGEKTVTITTTEDGEEKVKVLKGKDAEKYIKENDENGHKIIIKKFKNGDDKVKKIIKKEIKKIED